MEAKAAEGSAATAVDLDDLNGGWQDSIGDDLGQVGGLGGNGHHRTLEGHGKDIRNITGKSILIG